jgi:hypothetical protein
MFGNSKWNPYCEEDADLVLSVQVNLAAAVLHNLLRIGETKRIASRLSVAHEWPKS